MGTWQLDPYHTQVEFSAKHLGMMTVRGHFAEVTTKADIDPDHPETAFIDVYIEAASIRTHNPTRDDDLRSPNFLDVADYPTITFRSTSVDVLGKDKFRLNGDLTIKGNTRPISLDLERYGEFNDEMMGHRIAYSARGAINRKDYGLTFNMLLDGRLVVSDVVRIEIEGELIEQPDSEGPTASGA
jgi:polyisoprenoid-binding protein YceI